MGQFRAPPDRERGDRVTDPTSGAAPAAVVKHKPNRVELVWHAEHRFTAGRPGGPTLPIDGDGITAPGPVDTMLSSLAGCASVDVIDILAKRRTPIQALRVEVVGRRVETIPRRLSHVLLRFHITAQGLDRENAERAVQLSVEKYCSVRSSLDRDIPVEWEVELH